MRRVGCPWRCSSASRSRASSRCSVVAIGSASRPRGLGNWPSGTAARAKGSGAGLLGCPGAASGTASAGGLCSRPGSRRCPDGNANWRLVFVVAFNYVVPYCCVVFGYSKCVNALILYSN